MTDLVPGLSIDGLLQQRDAVVERITTAHRLLEEAGQIAEAILGEAYQGHKIELQTYGTRRSFTGAGGEQHLVKEIDGQVWKYLLQVSGMQTFLDADARKKWSEAIDKNDVPPLTRANIDATFSMLYETRGEMFERGVVQVFRSLSWDYKTNSPRAFDKRLVLRYIVGYIGGGYGGGGGGVDHDGADKLDDLVRVLSVLDGKPEPDHRNACYRRLSDLKWMRSEGGNLAALDYFTIRGFKNRNGHLTFTRPDLVDKLNQILAKHHPNALPAAEDSAVAA